MSNKLWNQFCRGWNLVFCPPRALEFYTERSYCGVRAQRGIKFLSEWGTKNYISPENELISWWVGQTIKDRALFHSKRILKFIKIKKKSQSPKINNKKKISFFCWAKKTKVFSTEQKKLNFCFWKFSGFFSGFCPHRQDSFRFALIFSFVKHDFSCAFFSYYKKLLKNVLYYETKLLIRARGGLSFN